MQAKQERALEAFERMEQFLDEHDAELPGVNASSARKQLRGAVKELVAHRGEQESGMLASRGGTAVLESLRAILRDDHMLPVVAIAKAALHDVPAFESVKLPSKQVSSQRLVGVATALIDAASQHKQVFVDAGLPEDFLEQMQAAANDVEQAVNGRAHDHGRHIAATKGLETQVKKGHAASVVLDALVVHALGTNAHLIQAWKRLKRVMRKGGAPAGTVVGPAEVTNTPRAA